MSFSFWYQFKKSFLVKIIFLFISVASLVVYVGLFTQSGSQLTTPPVSYDKKSSTANDPQSPEEQKQQTTSTDCSNGISGLFNCDSKEKHQVVKKPILPKENNVFAEFLSVLISDKNDDLVVEFFKVFGLPENFWIEFKNNKIENVEINFILLLRRIGLFYEWYDKNQEFLPSLQEYLLKSLPVQNDVALTEESFVALDELWQFWLKKQISKDDLLNLIKALGKNGLNSLLKIGEWIGLSSEIKVEVASGVLVRSLQVLIDSMDDFVKIYIHLLPTYKEKNFKDEKEKRKFIEVIVQKDKNSEQEIEKIFLIFKKWKLSVNQVFTLYSYLTEENEKILFTFEEIVKIIKYRGFSSLLLLFVSRQPEHKIFNDLFLIFTLSAFPTATSSKGIQKITEIFAQYKKKDWSNDDNFQTLTTFLALTKEGISLQNSLKVAKAFEKLLGLNSKTDNFARVVISYFKRRVLKALSVFVSAKKVPSKPDFADPYWQEDYESIWKYLRGVLPFWMEKFPSSVDFTFANDANLNMNFIKNEPNWQTKKFGQLSKKVQEVIAKFIHKFVYFDDPSWSWKIPIDIFFSIHTQEKEHYSSHNGFVNETFASYYDGFIWKTLVRYYDEAFTLLKKYQPILISLNIKKLGNIDLTVFNDQVYKHKVDKSSQLDGNNLLLYKLSELEFLLFEDKSQLIRLFAELDKVLELSEDEIFFLFRRAIENIQNALKRISMPFRDLPDLESELRKNVLSVFFDDLRISKIFFPQNDKKEPFNFSQFIFNLIELKVELKSPHNLSNVFIGKPELLISKSQFLEQLAVFNVNQDYIIAQMHKNLKFFWLSLKKFILKFSSVIDVFAEDWIDPEDKKILEPAHELKNSILVADLNKDSVSLHTFNAIYQFWKQGSMERQINQLLNKWTDNGLVKLNESLREYLKGKIEPLELHPFNTNGFIKMIKIFKEWSMNKIALTESGHFFDLSKWSFDDFDLNKVNKLSHEARKELLKFQVHLPNNLETYNSWFHQVMYSHFQPIWNLLKKLRSVEATGVFKFAHFFESVDPKLKEWFFSLKVDNEFTWNELHNWDGLHSLWQELELKVKQWLKEQIENNLQPTWEFLKDYVVFFKNLNIKELQLKNDVIDLNSLYEEVDSRSGDLFQLNTSFLKLLSKLPKVNTTLYQIFIETLFQKLIDLKPKWKELLNVITQLGEKVQTFQQKEILLDLKRKFYKKIWNELYDFRMRLELFPQNYFVNVEAKFDQLKIIVNDLAKHLDLKNLISLSYKEKKEVVKIWSYLPLLQNWLANHINSHFAIFWKHLQFFFQSSAYSQSITLDNQEEIDFSSLFLLRLTKSPVDLNLSFLQKLKELYEKKDVFLSKMLRKIKVFNNLTPFISYFAKNLSGTKVEKLANILTVFPGLEEFLNQDNLSDPEKIKTKLMPFLKIYFSKIWKIFQKYFPYLKVAGITKLEDHLFFGKTGFLDLQLFQDANGNILSFDDLNFQNFKELKKLFRKKATIFQDLIDKKIDKKFKKVIELFKIYLPQLRAQSVDKLILKGTKTDSKEQLSVDLIPLFSQDLSAVGTNFSLDALFELNKFYLATDELKRKQILSANLRVDKEDPSSNLKSAEISAVVKKVSAVGGGLLILSSLFGLIWWVKKFKS